MFIPPPLKKMANPPFKHCLDPLPKKNPYTPPLFAFMAAFLNVFLYKLPFSYIVVIFTIYLQNLCLRAFKFNYLGEKYQVTQLVIVFVCFDEYYKDSTFNRIFTTATILIWELGFCYFVAGVKLLLVWFSYSTKDIK